MSNLRGIFNMIKRRIVYSASSLLSVLSIVGCNFKGNTDMQTDSKINCAKWDAFANQVGIQTCDQAVLATNKNGIVEYLKKAPTHFNPTGDKYNDVTNLVEKYVKEMAPKTQASEIVSVKKLADVLKESGFEEHTSNKDKIISIPYFDRDVTDETGKVTTPGSYKDLSGYKTLSGLNKDSKFKIYSTKEGLVYDKLKEDIAEGTAYVLTYKLNGSNQKYSAIVTVPDNVPVGEKLPLIMYAHGGDAGLSFRNMATILQNNLSKGIVAAPSFPGEPICSITTIGGSAKNNFVRSCGDASYQVINPAVNPEGEKSPLDNDVNAFLGLHNAIFRIYLKDNKSIDKIKTGQIDPDFTRDLKKLDFYLPYSDTLDMNSIVNNLAGPKTIGVSDSRGGSTLLAAVGRSGVLLKSVFSSGLDKLDMDNLIFPPLFSSAALFYSPSSLLVGSFRIITQNLISGNIYDTSSLNALPMIPDLKKNKYFTNYINTPVGQDKDQLNNLVGWVASSDITYLAPYTSVAMQNWSVSLPFIGKLFSIKMGMIDDEIKTIFNKEFGKFYQKASIDKLPDGKDNSIKYLFNYLDKISTNDISNNSSNKSLINYIFEASNKSVDPNSAKCNIMANLKVGAKTDCSIANILDKGEEGFNLAKLDSFNSILENMTDDQKGLKVLFSSAEDKSAAILNLMTTLKETDSKLLINYLIVLSLSALNKQDSSIQLTPSALLAEIGSAIKLITDNQALIAEQKPILEKSLKAIQENILSYRKTAPGSIIFMHSTQDSVVPYTQSVIAKTAMDSVFDAVYGEQKLAKNPLTSSQVPALGSQLFAFQPDNSFYAVNLGDKTLDGSICEEKSYDGSFAANYNTTVKKCFGNHPLSSFGDGLLSHGDSAVRTSRLISVSLLGSNFANAKVTISNALLYGNQTFNPENKKPVTASESNIKIQFAVFNKFYNLVNKVDNFYSTDLPCKPENKVTGICYLMNADSNTNIPLFNRTLLQDAAFQKDAIVNGKYDETAQKSSLTPTDIFTLWMDSSAKESSKPSN